MKINEDKYDRLMGLSKFTLKKFPFGHVQTLTYGPKRIGKSIYYLLVMMDMYYFLYPDMSIDQRFKKALGNTIFTIDDFVQKIKKLQRKYEKFKGADTPKETTDLMIEKGIPEPAIHVDDAGVGFNKYKYFSARAEVEELKSVIDTIGTVVTGLYLSSPTLRGVLGFLQEYEGYRIHIIQRSDDFRRIAKLYKLIELPSGSMRVKPPKNDPFNCWLPSDLYNIYRKKRATYLRIGLENLEKYQKKLKDRKKRDPDLERTIVAVHAAEEQMKEDGII